jgi:hypothetical protein
MFTNECLLAIVGCVGLGYFVKVVRDGWEEPPTELQYFSAIVSMVVGTLCLAQLGHIVFYGGR